MWNKYQSIFYENTYGDDFWNMQVYMPDNDNLFTEEVKSILIEYDDLLFQSFVKLFSRLTKKQQNIINLLSEGLTQQEVADKLGVLQNTISSSINSNRNAWKSGIRSQLVLLIKDDDNCIDNLYAIYVLSEGQHCPFLPVYNRITRGLFTTYSGYEEWIK